MKRKKRWLARMSQQAELSQEESLCEADSICGAHSKARRPSFAKTAILPTSDANIANAHSCRRMKRRTPAAAETRHDKRCRCWSAAGRMKPRQHLALSIAEPRFDRLWHIRRRKCLTPEPSLSVVHARRPHEECLRRSFHAFRDSPRAEHARKRDYASQQTVGASFMGCSICERSISSTSRVYPRSRTRPLACRD